jgi:hypothetical protein
MRSSIYSYASGALACAWTARTGWPRFAGTSRCDGEADGLGEECSDDAHREGSNVRPARWLTPGERRARAGPISTLSESLNRPGASVRLESRHRTAESSAPSAVLAGATPSVW